jgi:WD40 repeat protein
MSESNAPWIGLTRRDFIAGASGAGAGLLLHGSTGALAMADDANPTTRKQATRFFGPTSIHSDRPTCVVALSDTRAVATDEQGKVRVWDITPTGIRVNLPPFKEHGSKKATYVAVSDKAQSKLLFSTSYDRMVNVSSLENRNYIDHFDKHEPNSEVWCVAASDDGTRAVSATNGGEILLWDPVTRNPLSDSFGYTNDPVGGVAFLPNKNDQFLSVHGHGRMVLWDLQDLKNPKTISVYPPEGDPADSLPVNSVAVSRAGNFAATGHFDMMVRVWDLSNAKQPLHVFDDHKNYVWRVAFSPNGKLIASAGEDGKVFVWRKDNWQQHQPPKNEIGGVMGVAFTPSGKIFYTSGDNKDPAVKFWDIPAAP